MTLLLPATASPSAGASARPCAGPGRPGSTESQESARSRRSAVHRGGFAARAMGLRDTASTGSRPRPSGSASWGRCPLEAGDPFAALGRSACGTGLRALRRRVPRGRRWIRCRCRCRRSASRAGGEQGGSGAESAPEGQDEGGQTRVRAVEERVGPQETARGARGEQLAEGGPAGGKPMGAGGDVRKGVAPRRPRRLLPQLRTPRPRHRRGGQAPVRRRTRRHGDMAIAYLLTPDRRGTASA